VADTDFLETSITDAPLLAGSRLMAGRGCYGPVLPGAMVLVNGLLGVTARIAFEVSRGGAARCAYRGPYV